MRSFRAVGVFLILLTSYCFGQTGTTSLRGTVIDKTGAAVADAKVAVTNKDQGLQRETQTDNAGEYHFLALPHGTYTLAAEKALGSVQRNQHGKVRCAIRSAFGLAGTGEWFDIRKLLKLADEAAAE